MPVHAISAVDVELYFSKSAVGLVDVGPSAAVSVGNHNSPRHSEWYLMSPGYFAKGHRLYFSSETVRKDALRTFT